MLQGLDTTQMLMVVQKQEISNMIIIPNNFCSINFALTSVPGCVPDQALLLADGVVGHHPDGHGGLETKNLKHHCPAKQLLLL